MITDEKHEGDTLEKMGEVILYADSVLEAVCFARGCISMYMAVKRGVSSREKDEWTMYIVMITTLKIFDETIKRILMGGYEKYAVLKLIFYIYCCVVQKRVIGKIYEMIGKMRDEEENKDVAEENERNNVKLSVVHNPFAKIADYVKKGKEYGRREAVIFNIGGGKKKKKRGIKGMFNSDINVELESQEPPAKALSILVKSHAYLESLRRQKQNTAVRAIPKNEM